MLTAFARHPDGRTESLAKVDDVGRAWTCDGVLLWVDLAAPSEEAIRRVGEVFRLDSGVVEDCLHGEQRPRIDEFEEYIVVIVYGMLGLEENGDIAPRKLAAVCGRRLLITVHREPLRTIAQLRERYRNHESQVLKRGVDFVLFTIVDQMVDNYVRVADGYEDRLDGLEEASLKPTVTDALLPELVGLRRALLELRRMAASESEMLSPVVRGEYECISEHLAGQFRHVLDHLHQVVEQVDALRELLNSVRDNYHAVIANRMNGVMKTLTMFATVVLPLSLVAGIYGMNLPLWPPPDHPLSFRLVLGFMAASAVLSITLFRRMRWL